MPNIFLNDSPSPMTTTLNALFDMEKDMFTQNALETLKKMLKMKTFNFLNRAGKWKIIFLGPEMCRTEQLSPN